MRRHRICDPFFAFIFSPAVVVVCSCLLNARQTFFVWYRVNVCTTRWQTQVMQNSILCGARATTGDMAEYLFSYFFFVSRKKMNEIHVTSETWHFYFNIILRYMCEHLVYWLWAIRATMNPAFRFFPRAPNLPTKTNETARMGDKHRNGYTYTWQSGQSSLRVRNSEVEDLSLRISRWCRRPRASDEMLELR